MRQCETEKEPSRWTFKAHRHFSFTSLLSTLYMFMSVRRWIREHRRLPSLSWIIERSRCYWADSRCSRGRPIVEERGAEKCRFSPNGTRENLGRWIPYIKRRSLLPSHLFFLNSTRRTNNHGFHQNGNCFCFLCVFNNGISQLHYSKMISFQN